MALTMQSRPKEAALWAVMCYNVRVWMMVYNHMLVPDVGQININHHHRPKEPFAATYRARGSPRGTPGSRRRPEPRLVFDETVILLTLSLHRY